MSAPELNRKITVTWSILILAGGVLITTTTTINQVLSQGSIIEANKKHDEEARQDLKEYILAEIQGLRADMTKEDNLIREEIQRLDVENDTRQDWQNARMDRGINIHEAIYHKKQQ